MVCPRFALPIAQQHRLACDWLRQASGSDQSELRSFLNELGEGGSEGEAGEERRCVTSPKLFVEAFV